MKLIMQDRSYEMFGKYVYCTQHEDGLFYSDDDFVSGKLHKGALPSPRQSTPELTAKARKMHEDAANKLTAALLKTEKREQPWWKFWA